MQSQRVTGDDQSAGSEPVNIMPDAVERLLPADGILLAEFEIEPFPMVIRPAFVRPFGADMIVQANVKLR